MDRSRSWALRMMHEASLHAENCVLTLTVEDGSSSEELDQELMTLFLKRLRREANRRCEHKKRSACARCYRKIRYYYCGEYGDRFGRPHYHVVLFGYEFPDRYQWTRRRGYAVLRSPMLEELWRHGISEISAVTPESAAYVAGYVTKKLKVRKTGPRSSVDVVTGEVFERVPEFQRMSLKPGLAKEWYEKFKSEVYPSDSVIKDGRLVKPPRYYDKMHAVLEPTEYEAVCSARQRARRREDETPERLAVRETVVKAQLGLKGR